MNGNDMIEFEEKNYEALVEKFVEENPKLWYAFLEEKYKEGFME
jgi:hypothetical protein